MSFREKVQSKEILNEIDEDTREIIINKTELIWLLDNIHSNEQIIRKLKTRMSHYEDSTTTLNSSQIIDKLQGRIEELINEKQLIQDDVCDLNQSLNQANSKLEDSRKETNKKVKKLEELSIRRSLNFTETILRF